MRARSKRYRKDATGVGEGALPLGAAVAKLKGWATTKFDQTVECVAVLGIDAKQAEQTVRGAISLPHGIGKSLRVVAFCEGEDVEKARQAGAIEAGAEELIKKIEGGWMDFDVAVAQPRLMGKVGKLGRVLGPQGKMPSPKSGTVTANVAEAVKEYAAGKVEFRNDSGGNVHGVVGKLSFPAEKLAENTAAFLEMIRRLKPSVAKGTYIKKVFLSGAMSPSVQVEVG